MAYRNATPNELCTSWFSSDLARPCPKLLERDHIPEGTTRYIERRLSAVAARVEETDNAITVSNADAAY